MRTVYDLSNPFQAQQFEVQVERLRSKKDVVRLEHVPKPRSNNQNKYLHALYGLMAQYTGYSTEEVKTISKRHLGYYYERGGHKFLVETSKMDTKQMTEFIDKVRLWGIEDVGCYLPTVEEWQGNWKELETQV